MSRQGEKKQNQAHVPRRVGAPRHRADKFVAALAARIGWEHRVIYLLQKAAATDRAATSFLLTEALPWSRHRGRMSS